jgi:hypothetical protein
VQLQNFLLCWQQSRGKWVDHPLFAFPPTQILIIPSVIVLIALQCPAVGCVEIYYYAHPTKELISFPVCCRLLLRKACHARSARVSSTLPTSDEEKLLSWALLLHYPAATLSEAGRRRLKMD